jgi:hypothetical protein
LSRPRLAVTRGLNSWIAANLAGQDPPEIPLARQFGPELLLCSQIGAIPPLKFTLLQSRLLVLLY